MTDDIDDDYAWDRAIKAQQEVKKSRERVVVSQDRAVRKEDQLFLAPSTGFQDSFVRDGLKTGF